MDLKNTSLKFLFLGSAVLLLSSCSQTAETETKFPQKRQNENSITVVVSPWPPDGLNYLAQEKGFFEKNEVPVELLWADGYEQSFDLVKRGELDIWTTALLDAVGYRAENGFGEAVLVQDYSAGADAVVAKAGIEKISDLAGKRVGLEKGTIGEFFLKVLVEREGMILSDISIIDTPSEEVAKKLKEGLIDAGVCYEPCPTDALNEGGRIITDSSKEPNLIADVYLVNGNKMELRKEDYKKVLKSIIEASEYFNNHPAESAAIMAEVLDMSKEEIMSTFRNLRIPNLQENFQAFDRRRGMSNLDELAKSAHHFLEQQELIEESLNITEVINPTLIQSIYEENK